MYSRIWPRFQFSEIETDRVREHDVAPADPGVLCEVSS